MSLINEALKKAQRQRTPDAGAPDLAAPANAPSGPVVRRSRPMPAQTLLLIVADVPKPVSDGMIWLSTGLLALSFTLYLRRAAQVLRAPIEEALATARTKS